jgi:hypothetical protein
MKKGSIMEVPSMPIEVDVEQTENTDGNLVCSINVVAGGVGIQAVMVIFDLAKEDVENSFSIYHDFLVLPGSIMIQTIILPCYAGMHWSWRLNILGGTDITVTLVKEVTLHMPYTN